MKTVLFCLIILALPDSGEKFLREIALFQKESYFKQKVYDEHNWKSFAKLKEANEAIHTSNYDMHLLNAAVFFSTNKWREERKLKPLTFSAELRNVAVIHTHQMIEKKFLSHYNNRTPKLRLPENRIRLFIPKPKSTGENITTSSMVELSPLTYLQLADKITEAWMNSPPHKKTMLSNDFSHLGCAAMFETKKTGFVWYVKATQNFCSYF